MVHMKMVNNEIYKSDRTMGCFYNLLTFYLQKQSCIVKSLGALLQQVYELWQFNAEKVKSSCLASGKEAKFNDKSYTLHATGPPLGHSRFFS